MPCRNCQAEDGLKCLPNPYYPTPGESLMAMICTACLDTDCPGCGGNVYTCNCDTSVAPQDDELRAFFALLGPTPTPQED